VDRATLPLYARAGAVIPLDPVRQNTGQPVTEPTTLRVHPGADGDFTLYDDDGKSLANRDGSDPSTLWIRCRWDDGSRRLTLAPDPRLRRWPGGARVFTVEIAGSETQAKRVELRGEPVELRW
jgi:alpha-glucosidase/alpha-D-xyloside xylohydrolase